MIGTSLQRYEILEELGQGGMSVVYRGRDTTLDRVVAVKVLHEHLAKKQENRSRFRREAQAVARLQHDNIVDVYDYSDEDDDQAFIVMEYIPGKNLRDLLDAHGHPPPEVAAMIVAVLADALDHAHVHGVIHRDLKPENVMVDEHGHLFLMDFGIAHVADAETMTQTGSLLGSPAHMAPEIIDGQDVNHRSDIFSLGTVLYWLATGEFPFKGENAPQLLRQVLQSNYRDPEQAEPRISRPLAQLIDRSLSREPDDRFANVAGLRDALVDSLELLDDDPALEEELRGYFDDPDAYTERFEARIVDRLVASGRRAMEHDDVPTAIARFNRVLAYDPDNETVAEELEDLHARQASGYQFAIITAVALAAAGTVAYVIASSSEEPRERLEAGRSAVDRAISTARLRQTQAATTREARAAAEQIVDRTHVATSRTHSRNIGLAAAARTANLAEGRSPDSDRSPSAASARSRSDSRDLSSDPPPEKDAGAQSDAPPEETATRDESPSGSDDTEPETFTYRFKVLPLAARVFIDGKRYSVPEVLNGVSLERGTHHLKVSSPGCHDYETQVRVDGPPEEKRTIVLEWRDAQIQVLSNRSAVVYLNGDRSEPRRIGANGDEATLEIPFDKADSNRRSSRKRVTLEIRPRDDMQMVREQTVTLRPGEQTSVNVNFPPDR